MATRLPNAARPVLPAQLRAIESAPEAPSNPGSNVARRPSAAIAGIVEIPRSNAQPASITHPDPHPVRQSAPQAPPSEPSEDFLNRIPKEFARRHLLLSAGTSAGVEHLWTALTTPPHAIFNVGVFLGRPTNARKLPSESLATAIDAAFARHENARTLAQGRATDTQSDIRLAVGSTTDLEHDLADALTKIDRDLLNLEGKGPVIRLVDLVFFEALQRNASDIHVQPLSDRVLVRYRLDGVLHTVRELPAAVAGAIVGRIKVMAKLDLAERRVPQDGRATVTLGRETPLDGSGRRIDLRISTLPTTYGERLVVRLLDTARSPHLLRFSALGMPEQIERRFIHQVSRTSGIVLVTGPTGSGKTTTLYTALSWISRAHAIPGAGRDPQAHRVPTDNSHCDLNIMTIEDPVEYDLSTAGLAISQTQLNAKKGVTFATGLRHMLRQDPDVIMVGEIRDEETARTAVQASLTGHLVLSTLHTNDAPSAIARLLDLGVEPFLVASSLAAVLAQRLVRTTHQRCKGAGCAECLRTGFQGRLGVFELLVIDDAIRALIAEQRSAAMIRARATADGMSTLLDAGLTLARTGATMQAEVRRVIEGLEISSDAEVRA